MLQHCFTKVLHDNFFFHHSNCRQMGCYSVTYHMLNTLILVRISKTRLARPLSRRNPDHALDQPRELHPISSHACVSTYEIVNFIYLQVQYRITFNMQSRSHFGSHAILKIESIAKKKFYLPRISKKKKKRKALNLFTLIKRC